jgi:hypothetical protein
MRWSSVRGAVARDLHRVRLPAGHGADEHAVLVDRQRAHVLDEGGEHLFWNRNCSTFEV